MKKLSLADLHREYLSYTRLVPLNENRERAFIGTLRFGQYIYNYYDLSELDVSDKDDSVIYYSEKVDEVYSILIRKLYKSFEE